MSIENIAISMWIIIFRTVLKTGLWTLIMPSSSFNVYICLLMYPNFKTFIKMRHFNLFQVGQWEISIPNLEWAMFHEGGATHAVSKAATCGKDPQQSYGTPNPATPAKTQSESAVFYRSHKTLSELPVTSFIFRKSVKTGLTVTKNCPARLGSCLRWLLAEHSLHNCSLIRPKLLSFSFLQRHLWETRMNNGK